MSMLDTERSTYRYSVSDFVGCEEIVRLHGQTLVMFRVAEFIADAIAGTPDRE
jgi:hypothetical protein